MLVVNNMTVLVIPLGEQTNKQTNIHSHLIAKTGIFLASCGHEAVNIPTLIDSLQVSS